MNNDKKAYEPPKITTHGTVENLTLKTRHDHGDKTFGFKDPRHDGSDYR
jgi:hypothetical protein